MKMKPEICNQSKIAADATIYKDCRIRSSSVNRKSTVGDFSILEDTQLGKAVQIHRNNTIYGSLIGDHSYTGPNTIIMHSQIGRFCSISWNVSIGPADHDYERLTTHSMLYDNFNRIRPEGLDPVYNRFKKQCQIGSDVWIGANAVILRDVKIGHGAVIAANAVVRTDIEPYAIAGGLPARTIKYRFPEDIRHRLLKIKWWEQSEEILRTNFELISGKVTHETIEKLEKIFQ